MRYVIALTVLVLVGCSRAPKPESRHVVVYARGARPAVDWNCALAASDTAFLGRVSRDPAVRGVPGTGPADGPEATAALGDAAETLTDYWLDAAAEADELRDRVADLEQQIADGCDPFPDFKGVLAFTAAWCDPCKLDATARRKWSHPSWEKTVRVVDVDQEEDVARHYGIESVPTYVYVVDGVEVRRHEGRLPTTKQMNALITGKPMALAPPAAELPPSRTTGRVPDFTIGGKRASTMSRSALAQHMERDHGRSASGLSSAEIRRRLYDDHQRHGWGHGAHRGRTVVRSSGGSCPGGRCPTTRSSRSNRSSGGLLGRIFGSRT